MNRTLRNCPLCQHEGAILYNNVMASIGNFDLSYEVRSCPNCQSVFSDNLASKDSYDRYYATLSKHDWSPVLDSSDSGRCHRRMAELIKEIVSPASRILDIGCGTGHLLFCLKNAGFKHLKGLDPSPQSPYSAKEYFGLTDIHTGFIDTVAEAPYLADIDVCCITGVLEHLYSPREQLLPVVEHLKPGARIVVGVPDLDTFTVENREPFGELSLEHINYYSRRSLETFFGNIGCRLEVCTTHPGNDESNLLAIAVKDDSLIVPADRVDDTSAMKAYLDASESKLSMLIDSLVRRLSGKLVIYGAGSHTARLLPKLEKFGVLKYCAAIADCNPNLHGTRFGGLPVVSPDKLEQMPEYGVIISSFRFEKEICKSLSYLSNPIFTIYG